MAGELEAVFHTDRTRSRPLDLAAWSSRSIVRRLAENTCRLLSPVL
jgi:hypothetical protein